MKRIILFALLAALAIPATAQTALHVVTSWTPGVWPAGTPNCSATVTTNCASGQTLTITMPTGAPIVIPLAPAIATFDYSNGNPMAYGVYTVSVVTNGVGATATTLLTSTPATGTTVY